jgi:hypothetical protein
MTAFGNQSLFSRSSADREGPRSAQIYAPSAPKQIPFITAKPEIDIGVKVAGYGARGNHTRNRQCFPLSFVCQSRGIALGACRRRHPPFCPLTLVPALFHSRFSRQSCRHGCLSIYNQVESHVIGPKITEHTGVFTVSDRDQSALSG